MLKLIIFDMDGLMFDTEAVMLRAFLEVTGEDGLSGTKDQFLEILGLNSADIQRKYTEFFGPDTDAKDLYRKGGERKLRILKEEGIPIKAGLLDLLKETDRLGLKKAIASSSDRQMILENLASAGLADCFDLVLSSGEFLRGKPYPDIFLAVCERLHILPEEALVLEDSANGVRAAVAGGIPVIHVPDLVDIPEEDRQKCLTVCSDLNEVTPLLEHLVLGMR